MVDTKIDSVSIIKQLLSGDNSNGTSNNSIMYAVIDSKGDTIKKRQNSITAVTNLLKSLLDSGSAKVIETLSQANNVSESYSAAGAGFGKKVNSKYLPSYNVRTPVIELAINGFPIYPNKRILGTTQGSNAKLNFQSFSLSLPFGGVEKSVQGKLTLFSKNPDEILSYTESWNTVDDRNKSVNGFPMLSVKFGWALSDSTQLGAATQVNNVSAMSPVLNFLITNIAMEDPGTAGTTFTFTLADLGSTVLENSSDNISLASNFPQQQLRTILEGILRMRLFTLDDILYLGAKNTASAELGQTTGILTEADYKNSVQYASTFTGTGGNVDATFGKTQDFTFFTNTKSGDIGINNRNFMTVANELAAQCRCKWYPHRNDAQDLDSKENSRTTNNLAKLGADLQTIRSLPSGVVPPEIAKELAKSEKDGGIADLATEVTKVTIRSDTGILSLTKDQAEAALVAALQANLSRLSARCRLFWVPNVPADWNSTGSVFYTNAKNKFDATAAPPAPYTEGAWFLLPDILDDYDIFTKDLPVQYGPGASAMPYFYGSGQNVFQASLGTDKPAMFGEVLSLSTSHNSMIQALASSVNESLAYGIEGKRLTGLKAADGFSSKSTKKSAVIMDDAAATPEQKAAAAAKGQAKIDKAKGSMASVFKGALALGTGSLLIGDSLDMVGSDKSTSITDAGGTVQTAGLKIKTRVASFLRYPTNTKITILGDPNLLRLGPGCFELFSYYPVEHEDGTITQELNTLTSGVYFVTGIEHTITAGDFITTINGTKTVDPINVPSSITNKLYTQIKTLNDSQTAEDAAMASLNAYGEFGYSVDQLALAQEAQTKQLLSQFQSLNLNSTEFTSGLLAVELQKTLTEYEKLSR